MSWEAVVIGASTGGLKALSCLLTALPGDFPLPLVAVQHLPLSTDGVLPPLLGLDSQLGVRQVEDKERPEPGWFHLAPPGYHLLIEEGRTFALSLDAPVCHARPSIDVLFESAAEAYGASLIGIVLTGNSADGSQGLARIKHFGGLTVVQDPTTAEAQVMPQAACAATEVDRILPLGEISPFLVDLGSPG
jgi:two-component system chemotaxis response regulator CheB